MHKNTQPAVTIQPAPSLVSTLLFLLTFFFILSIGSDVFAGFGGEYKGQGFHKQMFNCTLTSKAALQACKNEAADDLWIAIGNCNNLSAADDRPECLYDARSTQLEDLQTCREQYVARQDICSDLGEAPYAPDLEAADFVNPDAIGEVETPNPYFPLVKGTTWIYKGETEEGTEKITVTVTDEIKEIEYPEDSGNIFMCREVRDTVKLVTKDDGERVVELVEDTKDWYAQDTDGNVWYFGEIALNYEDGEIVDVEGSWKAGVDGAKPGIVMLAFPEEGDIYRQEFLLGDAEDMALVLSTDADIPVPFNSDSDEVLQTEEWTPIEPDVVEYKYYVPGIGMVLEENPDTGERVELKKVITP
jgi:hypothetical protein